MAVDMLEMAAANTELDRLRGIAARLTARVVELRERLGETSRPNASEAGENGGYSQSMRFSTLRGSPSRPGRRTGE
jgi:hypothetical protein